VRRAVVVVCVLALFGLAAAGAATPAGPGHPKLEKFRVTLTNATLICIGVPCDPASVEISDNLGEFSCHVFQGEGCSAKYPEGTVVTINARADAPIVFVGWFGDCSGTGKCVLTMDSDHSIGANWSAGP
jgi:hypothetical protein